MQVLDEPLPGAIVIETVAHRDNRGAFVETFNSAKLAQLGINETFVQDNESVSNTIGTVRGLHLQLAPHAQGKLVRTVRGAIFDVAVDLRRGSDTYGEHCSVELTGTDDLLFWIPPGFAHGFCTLEKNTQVAYKVTSLYAPTADRSVRWDDPGLGIPWPLPTSGAVLSEKDATAPFLAEIAGDLS